MMTATYTCDHGYTLNGVSTRTCQADGTWSLTAPNCGRECFKQNVHDSYNLFCFLTYVLLVVDCGALNDTANRQVSTSSGTTFMNTATYTCNIGYTLNGATIRTCQANGSWNLTPPTCDRECFKQNVHDSYNLFSYVCFISCCLRSPK